MASEAAWQTGGAHRTGEASANTPMDQRTVESLLRRLVERVEESERRYSEALDELHARLDQLSQTTDAVRAASTPKESAMLDRLHDQVNDLTRRFEPQSTNPLEDFERLGKALSAGLDFAAGGSDGLSGAADVPSAFPSGPITPKSPETATQGLPDFGFKAPDLPFAPPALEFPALTREATFDKRLADVANELEHSLGAVMPAATIEALNTRLDEIASQLSQALKQAPKLDNLASIEKQLSDIGQQLSRTEAQLARMNGIEDQLRMLIERFDATPDVIEEIATKAANEAARQVAEKAKSATSEDRLNAMHRDLVAMSDKSRAADDRLSATLQAVHDSLKQLVQQVERGASGALHPPKPQAPFAERIRAQAEQGLSPLPPVQQPSATSGAAPQQPNASAKEKSPKGRLGGSIADFQDSEPVPPFGRGKRLGLEEQAVNLDAAELRKIASVTDAEFGHDELVAAARRAAQAAAIRAQERTGGGRARRASDKIAANSIPGPDAPAKRKRSLLMISAAILLIISAALLYGRLRSKPDVTSPAAEQSVPNPAGEDQITPLPEGSRHGTALPDASKSAPAPANPGSDAAAPARSGAWEAVPDVTEQEPTDGASTGFNQGSDPSPDDNALSAVNDMGGVTDVAKSSPGRVPTLGSSPDVEQLATLPVPAKFPIPPKALGPLARREAAASGDPRTQYAIPLCAG
jgi:localization factor PodJL